MIPRNVFRSVDFSLSPILTGPAVVLATRYKEAYVKVKGKWKLQLIVVQFEKKESAYVILSRSTDGESRSPSIVTRDSSACGLRMTDLGLPENFVNKLLGGAVADTKTDTKRRPA